MGINTNNTAFYGDFSSLSALKKDAKTQSQESLRAAAQQFESLFTSMMLKSMRAASIGDSLTGGSDVEFYQGMYDQQLAVQLSKGKGLGLADLLVQQLTRSGLAGSSTAANASSSATSSADSRAQLLQTAQALMSAQDDNESDSSLLTAAMGRLANSASNSVSGATQSPSSAAWPPKSPTDFVTQLLPQAQSAASQLGVDPCLLVAHAALETGWGQHVPRQADGSSSFNLFGIKASGQWQGHSVSAGTTEYEQGMALNKVERFKSYGSADECFNDYAALLNGASRYSAVRGTDSAQQFAQALQSGGYATDPHYAEKLSAVAEAVQAIRATVPTSS